MMTAKLQNAENIRSIVEMYGIFFTARRRYVSKYNTVVISNGLVHGLRRRKTAFHFYVINHRFYVSERGAVSRAKMFVV